MYDSKKKIKRHFRDVEAIWLYGPPGAGKSRFVRDLYKDDLYIKP